MGSVRGHPPYIEPISPRAEGGVRAHRLSGARCGATGRYRRPIPLLPQPSPLRGREGARPIKVLTSLAIQGPNHHEHKWLSMALTPIALDRATGVCTTHQ